MSDQRASWQFDGVVVDAARFRLTVNGVAHPLEPKSFRLLQFLIEHRERVVTKEEIFQTVWTGTFVSDNALTRAVAQIRKALDDDPRQPRFVETVQTIGYRFIARAEPLTTHVAELPPVPAGSRKAIRTVVAIAVACALLAIAAFVLRPRPASTRSTAAATFVPVQFSSSTGLDMGASFSPDGHLIAYASDRGGAFEIYVKSFEPDARELQLTSNGDENVDPAFSPDGQWVAFASMRTGGIFRVASIGGAAQRLTDFGAQPVWSPDSRTVVFRSSPAGSLSTTDFYWPAESNLWTVPAGGGAPTRLTGGSGQPAGGQSYPSFNRDGSEIRFLNHFKDEDSMWAYTLADGHFRKLFGSTTFPYSNPTFARDDTKMWFVNWVLNGNIGIWQIALDPATLTPLGEPEAVYPSSYAVPRDLALSADGKRLAFTAVLSSSEVRAQAMPPHPPDPMVLTHDTTFRYGLLRSSPDGTKVVYTEFPRNGLARQWVVNADGSTPQLISAKDAVRFWGSLTRDNRRVCYLEYRDDVSRFVSQNLADGSAHEFGRLRSARGNQVAFSADCTRVLFHPMGEERRRVYSLDAATGEQKVMAEGPEDMGFARFSRDDRWISLEVTHRERGGDDIAVLPAEGGTPKVILRSTEPTFSAGWLPDNDRILFAARRRGVWNIGTVSRTTGQLTPLTTYSSLRTYVRYPDWLAGDRIVYEFNETKGNVFVATLGR